MNRSLPDRGAVEAALLAAACKKHRPHRIDLTRGLQYANHSITSCSLHPNSAPKRHRVSRFPWQLFTPPGPIDSDIYHFRRDPVVPNLKSPGTTGPSKPTYMSRWTLRPHRTGPVRYDNGSGAPENSKPRLRSGGDLETPHGVRPGAPRSGD